MSDMIKTLRASYLDAQMQKLDGDAAAKKLVNDLLTTGYIIVRHPLPDREHFSCYICGTEYPTDAAS